MKFIESHEIVSVSFTLNGSHVTGRCPPRMHLADYLRHVLHRTGTHVGCEHGVCGACTVLVDGRATRSCLLYAIQTQEASIVTVEGLENDGTLSQLQQSFHAHFALQCGFCTPGILLSAVDLLNSVAEPDEAEIRDILSGHLCRCTGYEPIVAAILAVSGQRGSSGEGAAGAGHAAPLALAGPGTPPPSGQERGREPPSPARQPGV